MTKPVHATKHCRFYNYDRGINGGPRCSAGIDLRAPDMTVECCMPDPKGVCVLRQEYTDEERIAWKEYVDGRLRRVAEAVDVIPGLVAIGATGQATCPHCAGFLSWSRHRNGNVWLQCSGPDCIGPVHFNVPADRKWPASKTGGDA